MLTVLWIHDFRNPSGLLRKELDRVHIKSISPLSQKMKAHVMGITESLIRQHVCSVPTGDYGNEFWARFKKDCYELQNRERIIVDVFTKTRKMPFSSKDET